MKTKQLFALSSLFVVLIFLPIASHAQFGGLLDKAAKATGAKGAKVLGLDKMFKAPEAISTNFEDVNRQGQEMPDFQNDATYKALTSLPKKPDAGYVLAAGHYEITNKSYCLKAGTYAPSSGDGYIFTVFWFFEFQYRLP